MNKKIIISIIGALGVLLVLSLILFSTLFKHEHAFGEWYPSVVSTCTQNGIEKRDCSCGEYETREMDLLEHSYNDATCTTPQTCSVCGTKTGSTLAHSYVKGVCDTCDFVNPSAKSEQLGVADDIIEDMENLELLCDALTSCYQRAWYFSIYKAEDYYSYGQILTALSNYIGIGSDTLADATVEYLDYLGLEVSDINCLAVLRTTSTTLAIVEKAIEILGTYDLCNIYITSFTNNIEKINHIVVGTNFVEALVDYCNVVFNYYSFAKSPSGSYNSYTASISTYNSYLTNAKNALYMSY